MAATSPRRRRARKSSAALDIVRVPTSGSHDECIAAEARTFANGRVGFEAAHMRSSNIRISRRDSPPPIPKLKWRPLKAWSRHGGAVKDDWELATLREAGRRLSDAAKCIIPKALAGQSEREVASGIDAELRRVGFDKPAFDTIVAAGPNSAVPHYRAGDRQLAAGDLVILDFGGMFRGYAVDMTRTIVVGVKAPSRASHEPRSATNLPMRVTGRSRARRAVARNWRRLRGETANASS